MPLIWWLAFVTKHGNRCTFITKPRPLAHQFGKQRCQTNSVQCVCVRVGSFLNFDLHDAWKNFTI